MVVCEVVLVDAVKLLSLGKKIDFKAIQGTLKKYGLRVLVFPLLYAFSFSIFLFIYLIWTWGNMSGKEPFGLFFYASIATALLFLYILPYYFSARFVMLQDTKMWKSIYETFKLYWGRILDTITLAFFVGIINLTALGLVVFLSFNMLTLFGDSFEPNQGIAFYTTMLNSPVGTPLSLIATSFSTLWVSSSITIYFKKVEELGEFSE